MPVGKFIAIGFPIALGVVMIGAGVVNFVGPKSVRDSFVRWGYPAGFYRVTGGLQAIAGLLLLIAATSRAGANRQRRDPGDRGDHADPSS
jgi:hypothetical protein